MPLDCTAGEVVIDLRAIPPGGRDALIVAAFDRLVAGQSLVMVIDQDPRLLCRALALRYGDNLSVQYLERGPRLWRMRLRQERGVV